MNGICSPCIFGKKKIGVHKNEVQKSRPNFARTNFTDFMIFYFSKSTCGKRDSGHSWPCANFVQGSPPAVHFYPSHVGRIMNLVMSPSFINPCKLVLKLVYIDFESLLLPRNLKLCLVPPICLGGGGGTTVISNPHHADDELKMLVQKGSCTCTTIDPCFSSWYLELTEVFIINIDTYYHIYSSKFTF